MMNATHINNLEFAQKNLTTSGQLNLTDCPRLLETLGVSEASSASIRYTLTGVTNQFQSPSLHLTIAAQLPVVCQRCMDTMQIALDLAFDYVISDSAPDELDENDEMDWMEPDPRMHLSQLIEDELLLALPIAPVHEAACGKASMQSGEKLNPFAVLKGKF